jgi:phospholipase C
MENLMPATDPIKHVVALMLENHSFDQMLGCMRAVNPDVDGVDIANLRTNLDSDGTKYTQKETDEFQTAWDPKHEFLNVKTQLEDSNGGFIRDFSSTYKTSSADDRQQIMGFYGLDKLPALHSLARDFTICDRWFSSLPGPTWQNRFFSLSGTSNGEIAMPDGFEQANPLWYLHQSQDTIFDRLNEKGKNWKVYYYDFPNSWLLLHQLTFSNRRRYHKIDNFFNVDVRDEKTFPEFVLIEPKYFGQDQNDDHPPHNIIKAEKLIADVYNAIRSNPDLWNSTLLVVYFDEHGGFYDHVVPPAATPPDDKTKLYAFNQFGVRVPSILISPWVGKRAEHTIFDHTSLLKYLIDKWGLRALGNRTANANSVAVALTEAAPREDTIPFIRVPYKDLIPAKPELEKEDINSHQAAIQGFARDLEQRTNDSRFKVAQALPNVFARSKNGIGKKLIKAGNYLTKDYQRIQREKVDRLTNLVKTLSQEDISISGPPPGTNL